MKILRLIILLSFTKVFAQEQINSSINKLDKSNINFEEEWEKANKLNNKVNNDVIGVGRSVNVSLKDFSIYTINDSLYYEYTIIVNTDFGVKLYFDTIDLEEGATIRIFNGKELKTQISAFKNKKWTTVPMKLVDPDLTIQLVHPVGLAEPQIHLNNVGYFFYDYIKNVPYKKSLAFDKKGGIPPLGVPKLNCHNDMKCSLGSGWESEASSVALIVEEFMIPDPNNPGQTIIRPLFASGFLVNQNTPNIFKKAYLLTAHHVMEKQEMDGGYQVTPDPQNWEFYFNYDAASCNSAIASSQLWYAGTGRVFAAAFPTSSGYYEDTPKDLLMLELNIPMSELASHNVCLAGWDAPINNPIAEPSDPLYMGAALTGIHHPAGALKKISQTTVQLSFPQHPVTGERIWFFDNWTSGATEPGSSGSPLFINSKKVIGVYLGRFNVALACPPAQQQLVYCPFFQVYTKNYETNGNGLNQYLDPNFYNSNPIRSIQTYCPADDEIINPTPVNPFGNVAFYLDDKILGTAITPNTSLTQADPKTCRTLFNDFDNNNNMTNTVYNKDLISVPGISGNGTRISGKFYKNPPVGVVGYPPHSPLGASGTVGYMGGALLLDLPATNNQGSILGTPLWDDKIYSISFYARALKVNNKKNSSFLMLNFMKFDWSTTNPATPGINFPNTNVANFNDKNKYGGLVKVLSDEWQYYEFYVKPPFLTKAILFYTDWGGVNVMGANSEYNIGTVEIDNIAICESCIGYDNRDFSPTNNQIPSFVRSKTYINAAGLSLQANTIFKAGEEITLNDGFYSSQYNLSAEIIPCYVNELPGNKYTNLSGTAFNPSFGKAPITNIQTETINIERCRIFPNPSNGTFNLNIDIGREIDVTVKIYDINGRLIQTVIDNQRVEAQYTSTIDITGFNNGIYQCVIQTSDGYINTQKLLLVR